jgi:hypothetical protein
MDRASRKRPRTGGEDGHTLPLKNVRPLPLSGFFGAIADKKRWRAQIRYYDGKVHNLGCFDTKQEAALAYDREARQCEEDTLLNYESIASAEEEAVQTQAEHNMTHLQQPKPRPASGFYGVHASGKQWQALINYSNTQHNLGSFDTKQEAALAYDRMARQRGKDKPLNYESITAAEEAAVQAEAEHILVHDMCAGPQQPTPRPSSGTCDIEAALVLSPAACTPMLLPAEAPQLSSFRGAGGLIAPARTVATFTAELKRLDIAGAPLGTFVQLICLLPFQLKVNENPFCGDDMYVPTTPPHRTQ